MKISRFFPVIALILAALTWVLAFYSLMAAIADPMPGIHQMEEKRRLNNLSMVFLGASAITWGSSIYLGIRSWRTKWVLVVLSLALNLAYAFYVFVMMLM